MSIISTLEQEEPILVTAKKLRRIVSIENDKDYYDFLKEANDTLIKCATTEFLNGYISLNSDAIY